MGFVSEVLLLVGLVLTAFLIFFLFTGVGGNSLSADSYDSQPVYSCSSYTPAFAGGSYSGFVRVNSTHFGVNCTTNTN